MIVRAKPGFLAFVEDESLHPTLVESHDYYVLALSDDHYRIVDGRGDPVLFPRALFDVVCDTEPASWSRAIYAGPGEWMAPGFWEDYFASDGDAAAAARNERTVVEVLRLALARASDAERSVLRADLERLEAQHPLSR